MSQITTHVLDTAAGTPAAGIPVMLEERTGPDRWERVAQGETNHDGRIPGFVLPDRILQPGTYRIRFETSAYFQRTGRQGFYPWVEVVFELRDTGHHHVPLLLSPFGYSTYRGS
jgi:5-hydroxyisourate hydrolase